MIRVALGVLLGLGFLPAAEAQQPAPTVTLTLTLEDGMLIAQTLGQIRCETVAQMATCEAARALLRKIRDQVGEQGK